MWQIGSGLGRGGSGGVPRLEWKVSERSGEDDMNVVLDYEGGGYQGEQRIGGGLWKYERGIGSM